MKTTKHITTEFPLNTRAIMWLIGGIVTIDLLVLILL